MNTNLLSFIRHGEVREYLDSKAAVYSMKKLVDREHSLTRLNR